MTPAVLTMGEKQIMRLNWTSNIKTGKVRQNESRNLIYKVCKKRSNLYSCVPWKAFEKKKLLYYIQCHILVFHLKLK